MFLLKNEDIKLIGVQSFTDATILFFWIKQMKFYLKPKFTWPFLWNSLNSRKKSPSKCCQNIIKNLDCGLSTTAFTCTWPLLWLLLYVHDSFFPLRPLSLSSHSSGCGLFMESHHSYFLVCRLTRQKWKSNQTIKSLEELLHPSKISKHWSKDLKKKKEKKHTHNWWEN